MILKRINFAVVRGLIIPVLAIYSVTAFTQSFFNPNAVVRSRIIPLQAYAPNLTGLRNPRGTKIYVEFLILKDRSLWFQPLFSDAEAHSALGPIAIENRGQPVNLTTDKYEADELMEWKGQLYVTLIDRREPEKRFLAQLTPKHGKFKLMSNLIWAMVPQPSAAFYGLTAGATHNVPLACAIFGTLAAVEYFRGCYSPVKQAMNGQSPSHLVVETLIRNQRRERLSVRRDSYKAQNERDDILLEDRRGQLYSLDELVNTRSCGKIILGETSDLKSKRKD